MDISSLQLVNQGRKNSGEGDESINGTLTSGVPESTEDTPLLQTQEGHVGTSSCGTIPSAHSIGRLSLDTLVLAKGENFSHGQRQVLSLCRAMVPKSKLMVLDEATANMDYDTDRMIQDIIRADLSSSGNANRTLVTIAHRLRTIVDYDKIVVLAAGQVVEVGSPKELYLAKGTFHDMVRHSGEEDDLKQLMIGN
jgi:ABC-type dipeptide/oligopeptide/nickel transport system ATPase subunit